MAKRKKPIFAVPVDQAAIEENPLLRSDRQINQDHLGWVRSVNMKGNVPSEETRQKLSAATKGRPCATKGVPRSEKIREILVSVGRRAKSTETKQKLKDSWTPERRAQQAERNRSEVMQQKLRQSWTPERRAAMSAQWTPERRAEQAERFRQQQADLWTPERRALQAKVITQRNRHRSKKKDTDK